MSTEAIMKDDGRSDWDRMNRRELWKALENSKIPYPTGCTAEEAKSLLQANKINPRQAIEWTDHHIQDGLGNTTIQSHPKRVERVESEADIAKRDAKMAEILEKQSKDNKKHQEKTDSNISVIESRMDELTKQVTLLTQALLQQKEPEKKPEKKAKETDPAKMKYMAFKKWCKERGHDLQKGEDKEELIKRLGDGQDPS